MTQPDSGWEYYKHPGGGWFDEFLKRFPEFDNKWFIDYAIARNRADRDSGELNDIALFEVMQLASEFAERRWRFPNVHGAFLNARSAQETGNLTENPLDY
jgi:hypothetical protein